MNSNVVASFSVYFLLVLVGSKGVESSIAAADNKDDSDLTSPPESKPLSLLLVSGIQPGHIVPLVKLGHELVKRGHNVSLCSPEMEGSDLLPHLPESVGINFISAGSSVFTNKDFEMWIWGLQFSFNTSSDLLTQRSSPDPLAEVQIQLRKTLDGVDIDFDVLVCDLDPFPLAIYFAQKGKKIVLYTPALPNGFPATTPAWPIDNLSLGQGENLSYLERLFNTIYMRPVESLIRHLEFKSLKEKDKEFRKVLSGIDIRDYPGIRVPLIITTAQGFEYPRTTTPLTHYVGPVLMNSMDEEIDNDLDQWLRTKENKSVIYVNTGATGVLTPQAAQSIAEGILKTHYSAIWSVRKSVLEALQGIVSLDKNRFYVLTKWAPREAILRHRTIGIAILHCGMNSVQEALYNSIPVIGIPHSFDHFAVAARIHSAGVGIPLYGNMDKMMDSLFDKKTFSAEQVADAIEKIDSGGYRKAAEKMRKIFIHAGGAERAADLVEFYGEVGYDHLIPAYAKYEWSWVQYYNVDVYITLLSSLLLAVFALSRIVSCACKWCHVRKALKVD